MNSIAQNTVTRLLALSFMALLLSACASNKDRPNRQVAVYDRADRVVYVSDRSYRCYEGQVQVIAGADTPVANADGSATLVGRRCYYADRYGRPLQSGVRVNGGVGVGIGGRGGIGGGVGVGVGRGGGSVNIGVSGRR